MMRSCIFQYRYYSIVIRCLHADVHVASQNTVQHSKIETRCDHSSQLQSMVRACRAEENLFETFPKPNRKTKSIKSARNGLNVGDPARFRHQ
jgi:hypothetical protein